MTIGTVVVLVGLALANIGLGFAIAVFAGHGPRLSILTLTTQLDIRLVWDVCMALVPTPRMFQKGDALPEGDAGSAKFIHDMSEVPPEVLAAEFGESKHQP